jgi:RES domain-containing protein
LALDSSLLTRTPLVLYRLTRSTFAPLTGAGSAAYPGRWNRLGQRAVYASLEQAACVLERLVHVRNKFVIPDNLVMLKFHLVGDWANDADRLIDHGTGATVLLFRSLREAEERFGQLMETPDGTVIAIAVPSVVVAVWNVVLYPEASAFSAHVSVEEIVPFEFDPRLFPAGAAPESA